MVSTLRVSVGTIVASVLGCVAQWSNAQATPTNDSFGDRAAITAPQYHFEGSIYGATSEAGEPLPSLTATQTLWWKFAAPAAGTLTVVTAAGEFVPERAFYQGSQIESLVLMNPLSSSPLVYRVEAGQDYALQLAHSFVQVGAFSLDTHFYPAATNNAFADSIPLQGTNEVALVWLLDASLEPGEPLPDTNGTKSLWWSWQAPAAGRVELSGGGAIQALTAYSGPAVDQLDPVAVRISGGRPIFTAEAGKSYHFQVLSGAGETGLVNFNFLYREYGPPVTDDFANARVVLGNSGGSIEHNVGATREVGEPAHRAGGPNKSIWWRWMMPQNGYATVANWDGTLTDVIFAVYQGTSVDNLHLVAKGIHPLRFAGYGGEVYYIAAETSADANGDINASLSLIPSTTSHLIPENLLQEPSFEGTGLILTNWHTTAPFGGSVNERGGADGSTWIRIVAGGRLSQDIQTVPGRTYQVRFAFSEYGAPLVTLWNDQVLGVVTVPPGEDWFWHWATYTVTATGTTSTLMFTNFVLGTNGGPPVALDGVSVIWADEPPSLATPLSSASVVAGGTVSFTADVRGSPPLSFRWLLNGAPIAGQTDRTLVLDAVVPTQAGLYAAVVTNAYGAVTSAPATLTVETPGDPVIIAQPYGDTVALGAYAVLTVAALGLPPLSYQWLHNGQEIPDATNQHLVISSAQLSDAGIYTARVSHNLVTVFSLPASLVIDEAIQGGGYVNFANRFFQGTITLEIPVFDVDGSTRLSGTNFVAQLYAGVSLDTLRPAAAPSPFRTGVLPGIFRQVSVVIANAPPHAAAFVQVRAWDATRAATYEEARALGSRFGKSEIFQVTPAVVPEIPANLLGLQSFSLHAGLPRLNVGIIEFLERQGDGRTYWSLEGEPGFRYIIERATNNFVWHPFTVITNITGSATFVEADTSAQGVFYRSRILD